MRKIPDISSTCFGRTVPKFGNNVLTFLDVNKIKDSSLLLHAIHSPFYWRILKKAILYSGFKNTYKTIREVRKLQPIHE
jgi:hypothetical protein